MKSFKKVFALLCTLLYAGTLAFVPAQVAHAVQMQFYEASIEISDSRPGTVANWMFTFKNKQEIPADGYILITLDPAEFTVPAAMDYEDFDLSIASTEITLAATPGSGASSAWGVTVVSGTSGSFTLTNNDTDTVAADSAFLIEIGTNATAGSTGVEQIVNPAKDAAAGTGDVWYVEVTSKDSGDTIIDTIELVVSTIESINSYIGLKPHMTFEITGVTPPTGGSIDSDLIEWREVSPLTPKTATMKVKVNTDATDGFLVYVKQNHNMQHAVDSAIDIDPIRNVSVGTNDSPVFWTSPTGTVIAVDTGFLGYTTSDTTLNNVGDGVNRFTNGTLYAELNSTSEEILYHDEATQSDVEGQDYALVTFQLEVNSLQPSGNYSNEIIFIVKPVF